MEAEFAPVLVNPGMYSSRGHDIWMDMFGRFLRENNLSYYLEPLKPTEATWRNTPTRSAWQKVEDGKMRLSQADANPGLRAGITSSLINSAAQIVRGMEGFNNVLTADYRRRASELAGQNLYSSHYLAFMDLEIFPSQFYIGPDVFPQRVLPKFMHPDIPIFAPCHSFLAATYNVLGNPFKIIQTGPILPTSLKKVVATRLDYHDYINDKQMKHRAFVSIGGSGPEQPQVLTILPQLIEQGIPLHIVCGDGRLQNIAFRRAVEAIYQENHAEDMLTAYGGVENYTKEDELADYHNCLTNPELTLALTRPNETLLITSALGMQVMLLNPYQDHEADAFRYFFGKLQYVGTRLSKPDNFDPDHFHERKGWIHAKSNKELLGIEKLAAPLGLG